MVNGVTKKHLTVPGIGQQFLSDAGVVDIELFKVEVVGIFTESGRGKPVFESIEMLVVFYFLALQLKVKTPGRFLRLCVYHRGYYFF